MKPKQRAGKMIYQNGFWAVAFIPRPEWIADKKPAKTWLFSTEVHIGLMGGKVFAYRQTVICGLTITWPLEFQ